MKIAILGGGESGVGAALLCQAKGLEAFVSDAGELKPAYREKLQAHGIRFEEGGHTEAEILSADEVVKSPGIPQTAALVQKIREQGIPIISEIELAARYTKAKFVAITGTNGKTTTTLLTYHLLKSAGLNVGLGGNVGESLAEKVINDPHEYYVVELSSFQLEDMHRFRAHIALLTNITPDHLDRYDYQMGKYAAAKFRVTQNQSAADYFLYNAEDEESRNFFPTGQVQATQVPVSATLEYHPGVWLRHGGVQVNTPAGTVGVSTAASPLIGRHNEYNQMMAIAAAVLLGVPQETIEAALATFRNAAHRLEPVATIKEVQYINDSKATNVEAVWYALDGVQQPIVWIAGGTDKGNDYTALFELAKQKVKALVCLGKDNSKLLQNFSGIVPVIKDTHDIKTAVQTAQQLAERGDVVLLSPACASFDLFNNYEHRGDLFREAVQALNSQPVS